MITIIDYGVGNVRAILNMLTYLEIESQISGSPDDILKSTHLILPGVGSFDPAMRALQQKSLIDPIRESVLVQKNLILGICLGMQLLGSGSEEGDLDGLQLIHANSVKLKSAADLKVPHIGWAKCVPYGTNSLIEKQMSFYFSHSYVVRSEVPKDIITAYYGTDFLAGFIHENIIGLQFHPERSSKNGIYLLNRFANYNQNV